MYEMLPVVGYNVLKELSSGSVLHDQENLLGRFDDLVCCGWGREGK